MTADTIQNEEIEDGTELIDNDEHDKLDEDTDSAELEDDEDGDDDDDDDAAKAAKEAVKEEKRLAAERELEAFTPQVEEIVKHDCQAHQSLTEESTKAIIVLYARLDGAQAKALARDWTEKQMHQAVANDDLVTAKVYMGLAPELKTTPAPKRTKRAAAKSADPRDQIPALAEQLATLDTARALFQVPEEVKSVLTHPDEVLELANKMYQDSWQAANDWVAYQRGPKQDDEGNKIEAPEAPQWVKNAAKLAATKSPKARKSGTNKSGVPRAPRRSPRKHIEECFADQPVGTFLKVSEITEFQSDEYGTDKPSEGAISANLQNEKFDEADVQPAQEGGFLGGKKVR